MGEFFLWILICCLVCYLVLLFRIFSQIYWKEHRVLQHIKFLFKSSPSWIFLIKFFFSKVVSSWCKQNLKKEEECFSIHNWSENYWFYNLLYILTLLWKWTIIVSIKSCILIELDYYCFRKQCRSDKEGLWIFILYKDVNENAQESRSHFKFSLIKIIPLLIPLTRDPDQFRRRGGFN